MNQRLFDIDQSATSLINWMLSGVPFFFVRIGDGVIECLNQVRGRTCDGEVYGEALAARMQATVELLVGAGAQVIWGDWRSADGGSMPRYVDEWEKLVHASDRQMVHYEALLLMRMSDPLYNFYRNVKGDRRRKVYVGPAWMAGVESFLQCDHIITPSIGVDADVLQSALARLDPQVVLFGAGMTGLSGVAKWWEGKGRHATCIHLGSALDPLFHKPTRSKQMATAKLREFFGDLL